MTGAPDIAALRAKLADGDGPRFWRSLDAVADSPEFRAYLAAEFPSASRLAAAPERRGFLKLMAASFALGGLTACGGGGGRDYEVPYVNQPERIVPGTDLSYASSAVFDGFGNGILVTTRNGRPLKIEGNPEHPWSRGGTDVLAQASVLGLYDPFRSQAVQHLGRPSSWAAFRADLQGRMPGWRENRGEGLALLTGPVTSPGVAAQLARLRAAYPALRWYVGAGAGRDGIYEGARQAYGRPLETRPDFGRARTIVALDGDFLDLGPGQVGLSRRWSEARRAAYAEGRLLTLHAAAPTPTLTSAKADRGLVVPAGRLEALARDLLNLAAGGAAPAGDDPVARWTRSAGTALAEARGSGIVTAGLTASPDLHALVHRLNGALGNTGATLVHTAPVAETGAGTLADLAAAMDQGAVKVLVVLGANPVYEAPGALDFAARMARVPLKIHAGLYYDETGAHADWHLPAAHPLESWGDIRSLDGTVGLIQPTVAPLYNGQTLAEMLAFLASGEGGEGGQDALGLLKAQGRNPGEDEAAFEARFSEALRLGFWADSARPAETVALTQAAAAAPEAASSPAPAADGVEVLFRPDPTIWDGTHADLAWLQELPKPLTKVVWENVIALSPRLAEREGIATGDILRVEAGGRAVEGPAWILPGQADTTVTLTLGYGRDVPDHLARGLGYDAAPLRPPGSPWGLAGARLTKTGQQRRPVTTQHLGTMEGQDLVRVQALGAAPVGDPKGAPTPASFYPPPESQDRWVAAQWGMAIDLDACTGCNACVTACQAENNIPVVGREEVELGRWMGWLRIDRYYAGDLDAPTTHFQPVPCMHCEQAPCELGCPVEATLHDSEGLNLQVYNRCVGTRTCQSYCPYKVRRFNYLDYTGGMTPVEQQQRNPEVTVRSRGVMEKCTYCIQRITAARITSAKDAHAPIPDGAVETACQGACPTRAITFGNVADPGSRVSAARRDTREYALLGHLNTRPRTTYLAGLSMAGPLSGGPQPGPLIRPDETLQGIGGAVTAIPLTHPGNRRWWIAFAAAASLLGLFVLTLGYLLYAGPGIWANNNAVVWALDIASYDWWIGVASGSLLVSAILLLLGAEWRGAVNRVAETLALLATAAAGLYPIIHLGRPWFFFWNLPYPNTYDLWPQFRSPLLWDAIDIVSFLVICVSLWFIGLLPDLATLRDRAHAEAMRQRETKAATRKRALLRAQVYGILASGWRGSAAHWQIWVQAYRTVALLGVLLVVSVQTGASVMLAGSLMPGWHSTLLPVSFLVNAVYSGVGVTAVIVMLIRLVYGLGALVTDRHLDVLGRLLLCLGCASAYCYAAEYFDTFLNGDAAGRGVLVRRMTGDHALVSWTAILCLVLPAQILWSARARTAPVAIAVVGLLVAIGAYADHVMVLVVTLTQDFLPSSRLPYTTDVWGIATFAGSVGLFLTLLLLFLRYLPAVSIVESRRLALMVSPAAQEAARAAASRATGRPEDDPVTAPLWGVSATFASQGDLAAALQAVSGISPDHVHLDGHGPVPMPRTLRALGLEGRSILPYALAGALLGGVGFFALCLYATAYDYVFLIGGRPRLSWPSFVVPSVSVAMMAGCVAIHFALLVLNRLPRLNHPAFNIPGFLRASEDRFFLSAEARGDRFDAGRIERRLAALPAEAGRPLELRRIPR